MTELRDELRRASRAVAPPDQALDEMLRTGERRRRTSRVGTAAFALGLTVAVLGGALFGVTRLGRGGEARVNAGGDLELKPGQYFYSRTQIINSAQFSLEEPVYETSPDVDVEIETWWALDNSGRVRHTQEKPGYGMPGEGTYGPGEFPLELEGITDVSDLSTDPEVLRGQLTERNSAGGASPQPDPTPEAGQTIETGRMIKAITYLLQWPNVTPELRVALYEVFADLSTVRVEDGVQDPAGRDAIRLAITNDGATFELYFDRATKQWMGTVETYGDQKPSYTIVSAAGFAGSTDEVPSGDALFFPEPQRELPSP